MSSCIQADTVLSRRSEVVAADLDDELVMMSVEQGNYYGLDSIGKDIWGLLTKPKSFQDLCRGLMERYSVDEVVCEKDVKEFLKRMIDEGLMDAS